MTDKTPDEVLAEIGEFIPANCVVQSAIVIVQTYQPDGETSDQRGPWLRWMRDTTCGAWNHLGQIETLADNIRQQLRDEHNPDDDW